MDLKQVTISTDGACIGNPGPGGYGVVLRYAGRAKEIAGGFRLTTNNRAELHAVIAGLRALKEPCAVTVVSDSQYVVESMTSGAAQRWRANGWMRTRKERALNPDLWQQLLELVSTHQVTWTWVKGHAGHPDNERCDRLALQAAQRPDLPIDEGYEQPNSLIPSTAPLFED